MPDVTWFDNPWLWLEKLVKRLKEFFKQTEEPKDVTWLEGNPWGWLENATKKLHKFLNEP